MYRVMLVDDEDIEREAMAGLIPWEKVGMELVDMAWNGIEGLEKIRSQVPDLVITDIKMPVMDGIELIRRAKALFPDLLFVVLSGYGDYEFTSQAMELGIRHYILKPCDEEKIVEVLLNAKRELEELEAKKREEKEYKTSLNRVLPRLKERILYELITKKELSPSDQVLLGNFKEDLTVDFVLLAVRSQAEFGQLDSFVLTNILTELLGEDKVYMSAAFRKEMVYLIPAEAAGTLETYMEQVRTEYQKYSSVRLVAAVSRAGRIEASARLYAQIQELFYFGELAEGRDFLSYDRCGDSARAVSRIVDYGAIQNAVDYGSLLLEIYASAVKMELRGDSLEQMEEVCGFALRMLFGEDAPQIERGNDMWELLTQMTDLCAERLGLAMPDTKDGERLKTVLYAIYRNIKNPDLSLQYLAQQVLFMNEDYFGRFFVRNVGEKYSAYLTGIRILLVQKILVYRPEIKLADLAELAGYPADGQYLTKVFKKQTGTLLSDFRRLAQENAAR